jgi:GNAT superfamily N-acetyltransferase
MFDWWLEPGIGDPWLLVRPESRCRGLGTSLYERVERDLLDRGARKLKTTVFDADGKRFAAEQGYEETRSERLSQLDVRTADLAELPALEAAVAREGFRLAPLRELLDRPRELHAMHMEAAKDMPGDDPHRDRAYREWREDALGDPLLELDGSMNVLHGDMPAAFAWIVVDREGRRGEHELTGTVRAYRGRGLARLAKLAVVRWCRENGIDTLFTSNDSANAAMLAINDRLGYRPTVVYTEFAKTVR